MVVDFFGYIAMIVFISAWDQVDYNIYIGFGIAITVVFWVFIFIDSLLMKLNTQIYKYIYRFILSVFLILIVSFSLFILDHSIKLMNSQVSSQPKTSEEMLYKSCAGSFDYQQNEGTNNIKDKCEYINDCIWRNNAPYEEVEKADKKIEKQAKLDKCQAGLEQEMKLANGVEFDKKYRDEYMSKCIKILTHKVN